VSWFAHSLPDQTQEKWHLLRDHLVSSSSLAGRRAGKFNAAKAAALAALLHDLGKYSKGFQRRLEGAAESVDHSTAGAQVVGTLVNGTDDRGMAELIAYCIAGHHGGLADMDGETGGLADRLKKTIEPLDPLWREELSPDASGLMPGGFQWDRERFPFQLAFLTRMIFSCLVDADFRDTEAFYARAGGLDKDRDWPALGGVAEKLRDKFDACMAGKSREGPVNRLRRDILTHVRAGAGLDQGLFSLTVPTGGGKTLASLGFALDHARAHRLERIIYAIPFTSVIDQTVEIFRELLGEGLVLEHHSAIDEDKLSGKAGAEKLKLAMEDWAAPVVVTTNVQLFESLFSNRPSRCRKLHNIARSVIVLDEAQTIPLHVLRPSVAALRERACNYGTSVVLCTATQPALIAPDFEGGFARDAVRELAPDPVRLHEELKRVTLRHAGTLGDDDLLAALSGTAQGLIIVNSRAHALSLYRQAEKAGLDGIVHLTTRQYAAHRRLILKGVKQRLKEGTQCRLIATSLVEAGIDFDFPRVWRAEAGLDSIAQAAGRCNREGRWSRDDSLLTVFATPDHPGAPEVRQLAGDMRRIAGRHRDLLSPAAIRDYFQEVYWRKGTALGDGLLEKFTVDSTGTSFAFRTVAEEFRLIKSGLCPIIIAKDRTARQALDGLAHGTRPGGIARKLQPFIVQVPPRARTLMLANGHVKFIEEARFGDQFAVLVNDTLYDKSTGLLWENAEYLSMENGII